MVHQSLLVDDLLRWTLSDIPAYAEEPYVYMAAYLMKPEFEQQADPSQWLFGMSQIQKAVNLRATGVTQAVYF